MAAAQGSNGVVSQWSVEREQAAAWTQRLCHEVLDVKRKAETLAARHREVVQWAAMLRTEPELSPELVQVTDVLVRQSTLDQWSTLHHDYCDDCDPESTEDYTHAPVCHSCQQPWPCAWLHNKAEVYGVELPDLDNENPEKDL